MIHRACLSLGSNVGDRRAILNAAVDSLTQAHGVTVIYVSSYYETPPIGGPSGQGPFLNAAAVIETLLQPSELMELLQTIESLSGRLREVRWGERTLDLDLLLYDDLILDEPDLTVPHPRMCVRRFVLAPLAEIAPEVVEPTTRQTITGLLSNLDRKPNFLCLLYLPPQVVHRVTQELNAFGRFEGLMSDGFDEAWPDLRLDTKKIYGITRRKLEDYSQAKWSTDVWGDRWMVSDFWPDLIVDFALRDLIGEEQRLWRHRFVKRHDSFVRPTFIATQPQTYSYLRKRADLNHEETLGPSDIPVLCPGYADPMGFIRQKADTSQRIISPIPEMIDRITHEILAACAAVRPESMGVPVAPPRGLP